MMNRSLLARLAALVSAGALFLQPAHGQQLAGAAADQLVAANTTSKTDARLTVTSTSFQAGGAMPLANSAYGENRSPQLSWTPGPAGTVSYLIVLEDPDLGAGRPPYLHWILGDLTASTTSLPEGLTETPMGAFQTGASIARDKTRYFGPRPPSGSHTYTFQVFALDKRLGLYDASTLGEVRASMEGHVLAKGVLQGVFAKP